MGSRGTRTLALVLVVAVVCALLATVAAAGPPAHAAATCSDFSNQAAAQRAANTRDPDHDGIYCESLPCPCLTPGSRTPTKPKKKTAACTRPRGVANITFSATKYPNIRRHFLRALRKGWPRTLVVNRPHASERRDRLLANVPTKPGYDRDEYPPAVGRGKGTGLMRGTDPTGWKADVAYVASKENRAHGSSLGVQLRRYCNGTRFRYVFF
jgi:hypothetical protein